MLLGKAGNCAAHSCWICQIGRHLSTDLSQFPRKAGLPRLQQCMLHAYRIMDLGGSRPCISAAETSPRWQQYRIKCEISSETRGPPRAQVLLFQCFPKDQGSPSFFFSSIKIVLYVKYGIITSLYENLE